MASTALLIIIITFNLLFFTLVSSINAPTPSSPPSTAPAIAMPPSETASPTIPPAMPPSKTTSPTMPPSAESCPINVLKLGVCVNLLNDLVRIVIGSPENSPCCTLISGLADLEAAVCLCTAINANVLGINLNVPISLSLLLNHCGKSAFSSFVCE